MLLKTLHARVQCLNEKNRQLIMYAYFLIAQYIKELQTRVSSERLYIGNLISTSHVHLQTDVSTQQLTY